MTYYSRSIDRHYLTVCFSRCSRLGLVSLAYLWRRSQSELLDEMIESKVEAIIIKVATLGLDQKHLGLSLSQVRDHLHSMVPTLDQRNILLSQSCYVLCSIPNMTSTFVEKVENMKLSH